MAAGVPAFEDDLDATMPTASRASRRGGRTAPRDHRTPSTAHVKHCAAPATGLQVEPQCVPEAADGWPALAMPALPVLDPRAGRGRATAPQAAIPAGRLARRLEPGLGVAGFLSRLPGDHAAAELRVAADAIVRARRGGHGVVLTMGALPIELGLSPVIVDLMERRVITAVALDGEALLRDLEVATAGRDAAPPRSRRARGRSTGTRTDAAPVERIVREAAAIDEGLGEAIGRHVAVSRSPQRTLSIAAAGFRLGIPVTAPVALGAGRRTALLDADDAAVGATARRDFLRFAAVVAGLASGVQVSLGHAMPLAEAFAAAIDLARGLGHPVHPLTTVAIGVGAGTPPASAGTRAIGLSGHVELLFPLLAVAVLDLLAGTPGAKPRRRS